MPETRHKVYVVGAGTGGHESLTEEARIIIGRCRYIAAGARLLPLAEELATGAETFAIGADMAAVRRFVTESLMDGDVCVLTSGDPGCFSILPVIRESFPDAVRVTPGISAVQTLAARLALPWSGWRLASLHGRGGAPLVLPTEDTLFFCDEKNPPEAIAARLSELMPDCPAVAAVALGGADEAVLEGTLARIAAGEFGGHSLLLVMPAGVAMAGKKGRSAGTGTAETAAASPPPPETAPQFTAGLAATAPGIPDGLWLRQEGTPLTKAEVRSVLMGKAQPARRRVIWDIGSGTGSYAVECALLAPGAQVIAIERDAAACHLISSNAERFGAGVEVVCAEAPETLETLAPPDLVIIGGTGGALVPIFKTALRLLEPGGRLVVTAVLEETKKNAHQLFAESGLAGRAATRVSIARGQAHEWQEQNPVIIFTGDKPRE